MLDRRRTLTLAALCALGLFAACAKPRPAAPVVVDGMLAGIIRDADTGQAIAGATVVLRRRGQLAPVEERTTGTGAYMVARLPPGSYQVKVYRDQRTMADEQVDIHAGKVTGLDLAVVPRPQPGDSAAVDVASGAPLWSFHPAGADPTTGVIEGTVTEQGRRSRLEGAVVNVVDRAGALVANAVSDDEGRYRVDGVPPGAYVVSAYYTLVGRGQFEIRRTDVVVGGGDVVVVPLAIETGGP